MNQALSDVSKSSAGRCEDLCVMKCIYLAKDGEALIVLFGGGTKRAQQRDIDQAKAFLADYKARKKAAAVKAGAGLRRR